MQEVAEYIRRVVSKSHLHRERYSDAKAPTSFDNIVIVPFFGDPRAELVFATTLVHRKFAGKYLIVVSWPGHSGIYPTEVSEFWCVNDADALLDLFRGIDGFNNRKADLYERILLRYFDNVATTNEVMKLYYNNGFTNTFLKEFKDIEWSLPTIPSANIIGDLRTDRKCVYLRPTKYIHHWKQGKQAWMLVGEEFWRHLVQQLLDKQYQPVLQIDYGTYDLSTEFASDCFYVSDYSILSLLAVMRACDCVVDLFNGISRYAVIARCPYFVCDERQRYFATNDYELDDLCGADLPKRFMFSFAPVLTGNTFPVLSEAILNNIDRFVATLDRRQLPSSVAMVKKLPYSVVRKKNAMQIGPRLVTVPKLED